MGGNIGMPTGTFRSFTPSFADSMAYVSKLKSGTNEQHTTCCSIDDRNIRCPI